MSERIVRVSTPREEIFNSITHGIGILFSITCLTLLVALSSIYGDFWSVLSCCIFGFSMMLMYTASTVYHAISGIETKKVLKKIDHISIYYLIAGTYTPILLVLMRNNVGWMMLGTIWGLALIGTILKLVLTNIDGHFWSISLYLTMGWLIVGAFKQVTEVLPTKAFVFLLLGGFFYTLGVFFYMWKSKPYSHVVWHCFVLLGSVMHFLAILFSCVFVY